MYEMLEADTRGILYKCRCGLKVRSAYPPERVHHQCPLDPAVYGPAPKPKDCGTCGESKTTLQPDGHGPGSKLLEMFETDGVPHCPECFALAAQMDAWGPDGCRDHLDQIVADILPRAVKWLTAKHAWAHAALAVTGTEDAALRVGIRSKVLAAIAASEQAEQKPEQHDHDAKTHQAANQADAPI